VNGHESVLLVSEHRIEGASIDPRPFCDVADRCRVLALLVWEACGGEHDSLAPVLSDLILAQARWAGRERLGCTQSSAGMKGERVGRRAGLSARDTGAYMHVTKSERSSYNPDALPWLTVNVAGAAKFLEGASVDPGNRDLHGTPS
jgi:hypothetical protein